MRYVLWGGALRAVLLANPPAPAIWGSQLPGKASGQCVGQMSKAIDAGLPDHRCSPNDWACSSASWSEI